MNTNSMPLNEEQGVPQWNYPSPQVNVEKTEPIPIPRSHCCCYLNGRFSAAVMHAKFQIRASSVHAAHGRQLPVYTKYWLRFAESRLVNPSATSTP